MVLNGYDELDTFKEIEKVDLDNLGIINPEHLSKLLRAVEMLQDVDPDGMLQDIKYILIFLIFTALTIRCTRNITFNFYFLLKRLMLIAINL